MKKVTLFKTTLRNRPAWVVSHHLEGKRERHYFSSKDAALAEAGRLREQLKTAGEVWCTLPAHERDALINFWKVARSRGIDPMRLLTTTPPPEEQAGPSLETCVNELIVAKQNSGRDAGYVTGLHNVLIDFATGRETLPIQKVDLAMVERYLDSKKLASRSTLRARISTLFKFCNRRGYTVSNPCAQLEAVSYLAEPPKVFTVEQTKKCLDYLRTHRAAAAWFVLTTFAGLRPEEAEKTTPADVHLGEGWIKVEAQTTKVRQRRVVYPRPEVIKLLRRAMQGARMPISRTHRRRAVKAMRDLLSLAAWPKDVTRHSAASYWLADCESTAKVARALGHSESVLLKNYAALVTKTDAQKFWRLCATA
jgi:integrase